MSGIGWFISSLFPTTYANAAEEKLASALETPAWDAHRGAGAQRGGGAREKLLHPLPFLLLPPTQVKPTWAATIRTPSHPRGSRCLTRRRFPPHETGARGKVADRGLKGYDSGTDSERPVLTPQRRQNPVEVDVALPRAGRLWCGLAAARGVSARLARLAGWARRMTARPRPCALRSGGTRRGIQRSEGRACGRGAGTKSPGLAGPAAVGGCGHCVESPGNSWCGGPGMRRLEWSGGQAARTAVLSVGRGVAKTRVARRASGNIAKRRARWTRRADLRRFPAYGTSSPCARGSAVVPRWSLSF
ncbi:hypothetical protein DFH09DRAFT_1088586 [Mycena vulgaris]|nr:hypothetical protein DFH09DRAFT_1088586 [Mycena vulgaris]